MMALYKYVIEDQCGLCIDEAHAPGLTYEYAARYSCWKFLLHNESPLIVYELYLCSAPSSVEFYKRAVVQD